MSWWHRLLRRERMEEQLEKELRFHLEQHIADLVAHGYDPAEARRRATLELGGTEQVKEQCRDARGTRWLEDLWQDLRYALRSLRQRPGFAAVALLTLALGTGTTTVMFTIINGVLLKPLPYPDPGRLIDLHEQTKGHVDFIYGDLWAFAYPNYLDCKRESHSLEMAAWRRDRGTFIALGAAEHLEAVQMSPDLFPMLGVTAFRGRAFSPEDDQPGAPPVALLSYGVWQRRFGASPSAIGMPMVFDGNPYTVVGIAPPGFRLSGNLVDLCIPLGPNIGQARQNRGLHPGINVFARLKPGFTLPAAQAELDVIGRHLAAHYPDSNKGRGFFAEPLRADVGDVRSTLWLLLGAVTLVLLIACVNVASLLLARAVSRERELAMRVALGAGRGRLARQCLTESAVLALSGGAMGVLLATLGIPSFVVFWPGSLPRAEEVQFDWRVLLFAVALALASGLLFGLAPAFRTPARHLEQALRAGARTVAGSSRRLHGGLVISEIALAVVLLVSAGMLGRTLLHVSSLDPGVNIRNVLVARMALSPATMAHPEKIRTAWQGVLDGARRQLGVDSIALVDTVPMREGNNQIGYGTTAALPPENQQPHALATSVTPDYLKVMSIQLRRGRFFDAHDRLGTELVAVIDDVLAVRAFGRGEPIGRRIWVPSMAAEPMRVVGVVGHVRYWGLAGDDQAQVRAQLYYPFAQVPDNYLPRWSELMSIAVRTRSDPANLVEPLRRELRGAAGDQVLYEIHTMDELASGSLSRQRFLLLLFGIFAALALLLACVGIYGVLASLTGQRVPEIGLRMALGANGRAVVWLVLRQSLQMVFFGVALGVVAALAAGRLLTRMVEGMQPAEPLTFAGMVSVLTVAALIASFVPARRASRVNPIHALRQD